MNELSLKITNYTVLAFILFMIYGAASVIIRFV